MLLGMLLHHSGAAGTATVCQVLVRAASCCPAAAHHDVAACVAELHDVVRQHGGVLAAVQAPQRVVRRVGAVGGVVALACMGAVWCTA
jgi:hypothetical protein